MPIVNPDTSQAQELGAIEPNTYKSKITGAEPGTSASGNAKVVVTFDIDVNGKNRQRQAHLPLTGAGSFGFDQLLRSTGFGEIADQIKANPGQVPFDTDRLIGQECNVVIVPDTYQGQLRDKIGGYLPI